MKDQTNNLIAEFAKRAGVSENDAAKVLKTLGLDSSLSEALELTNIDSINASALKIGIRVGKSAVAV